MASPAPVGSPPTDASLVATGRAGRALCALSVIIIIILAGCTRSADVPSDGSVEQATDGSGQPAKKVFKEDQTEIRVVVGETFAIRLDQNPSIGDNWMIVSAPDDSFVKEEGHTMKYDSPEPKPGQGGQVEFKFKAKKVGKTTVTMLDCYRCGTRTSVAPENTQFAKRLTFEITVS